MKLRHLLWIKQDSCILVKVNRSSVSLVCLLYSRLLCKQTNVDTFSLAGIHFMDFGGTGREYGKIVTLSGVFGRAAFEIDHFVSANINL